MEISKGLETLTAISSSIKDTLTTLAGKVFGREAKTVDYFQERAPEVKKWGYEIEETGKPGVIAYELTQMVLNAQSRMFISAYEEYQNRESFNDQHEDHLVFALGGFSYLLQEYGSEALTSLNVLEKFFGQGGRYLSLPDFIESARLMNSGDVSEDTFQALGEVIKKRIEKGVLISPRVETRDQSRQAMIEKYAFKDRIKVAHELPRRKYIEEIAEDLKGSDYMPLEWVVELLNDVPPQIALWEKTTRKKSGVAAWTLPEKYKHLTSD